VDTTFLCDINNINQMNITFENNAWAGTYGFCSIYRSNGTFHSIGDYYYGVRRKRIKFEKKAIGRTLKNYC
jgi:hypothetical protein